MELRRKNTDKKKLGMIKLVAFWVTETCINTASYPVIILVVMEVIRCQRCLRNRVLKAKLYRSLQQMN